MINFKYKIRKSTPEEHQEFIDIMLAGYNQEKTEQNIINLLREAIKLNYNDDPKPFSEEEYSLMYDYLAQLERNIQQ